MNAPLDAMVIVPKLLVVVPVTADTTDETTKFPVSASLSLVNTLPVAFTAAWLAVPSVAVAVSFVAIGALLPPPTLIKIVSTVVAPFISVAVTFNVND